MGAAAVAGSRPRVTSPQSVSGRPTPARSSFLGHPQRVDSALGRGAHPVGSDGASCPICLPQEGGPRVQPRGPFLSRGSPGPVAACVTLPQLPQTQTRADARPCQRGAAPPGPEGTGVSGCPGPLASQRGGARRAPHRRRCSLARSAVASPRGHPPTDTGAPSHVPLPRPRAPDCFLHSAI